jgi:aspartate kinase
VNIFKFGGASVNSVERIKNIASILQQYPNQNLVIIISAMGKTTNALEKVVDAFYTTNQSQALELFTTVKQQHLTTAKYLLVTHYNACAEVLQNFFTEVEWLLHDKPVREYDYYYDQIVSLGELFSTTIVSFYLNEVGINNTWLDVRDIIRTDDNFRDAAIDWEFTTKKIEQTILTSKIYLTQGFIGSTDENENTTLGREGSDYTAAIFANCLNAQSVTIWKDVEGVMNADPKVFPNAQIISTLSYEEVIEMAYYGAQVIHPKTIKPLHNKSIPLYVKCFLDASLPGTEVINKVVKNLPPIFVQKANQALLHLQTQDYSFVGQGPIAFLYALMDKLKIKPNLIQTGAISVQICIDDKQDKIEALAQQASTQFDVTVQKNLNLLTVRHYTTQILNEMLKDKKLLLQQKDEEIYQGVYI